MNKDIISTLTMNVPHENIEKNVTFKWDKYAYLNRKDATETLAIKLGCTSIQQRFGIIDNVEYDIKLFLLNPNYTFEQKVRMIPEYHRDSFIFVNGTLNQILRYASNSEIQLLQCRKDLTLEFWDKFTDAKVTDKLINSFNYENIQYHISLFKQSLLDKYICLEVLAAHRKIKFKDIHEFNKRMNIPISRVVILLNNLAKTLSYKDIIEIGIDTFNIRYLAENPDIDRLLEHLEPQKRIHAFGNINYMSIDTIKKYNLPISFLIKYNYNISIEDLDKRYNTRHRVRNRSINEVRIYADNLDKDEYIAYNKNVTLRDFELCINKFYGILKRNVIPMKINISVYNDIDIFIV
ncbi:hypothetical protein D3C87_900390 [compost metagenome]